MPGTLLRSVVIALGLLACRGAERPPRWVALRAAAPAEVVPEELATRGRRTETGWRVSTGRLTGDGLPVRPGERWVVPTRIAPRSALRFYATARALPDAPEATLRLRVELDEIVVWEEERPTGDAHDRWVEVALPRGGVNRAELAFAVAGPPAVTAFVAPRLGPAEPERDGRRPNVLLFLADTLRADLLAAYGGDSALMPHLNALADESVVFERAWGTSSWTLPSQASMFTGLLPPLHGAQREEHRLPEDLVTVAEHFRERGYRTLAVTDAGFVSATFGFAQGFEWYLEHTGHRTWSLDVTLQRAREALKADDGRPTLLFVHTYRTHAPYRTGPDESPRAAQRLLRGVVTEVRERGADAAVDSDVVLAELRSLYEQAAADLDTKLGAWWKEVRTLPEWTPGYLVVTSDHGEAFGEHGNRGHQGALYEELLRVPLLVHGRDLAPRHVPHAASLVDLPRTLAALAGLDPADTWGGHDLLALDADRPVHGFYQGQGLDQVALVSGRHKLLADADPAALARGELAGAFDLAADPGEREDLRERAEWPGELARELAGWLTELEARARPALEAAALDEATRRELEAIGY